VVEIRGFTIRYVDNAMDMEGTLAQNVLTAPEMLYDNARAYFDRVADFDPDVVFTDFDSFAYFFAKRHRIPVISIDNQQVISRCHHEGFVKKGNKLDYQLTKGFVRAKLPACDEYIITSFFFPEIRKKFRDNTTFVPPILRQPILDAKATARTGEHVLVYQTSKSDTRLIPTLQRLTRETFLVYGLGRDERVGNCVLKPFSEEGFVADLASAKAVVTNGGFSLIGEALYLGKPIYSVPVRNQFEQIMNARYLDKLGYGVCADRIDGDLLHLFLKNNSKFLHRVARHRQDENDRLFAKVDDILRRIKKSKKKQLRRELAVGPRETQDVSRDSTHAEHH
jgi:uncharacterized protein (TIGR00661 family)